jgi:hypothetical protein
MVTWGRAWRAAGAWFGWSIVWGIIGIIIMVVGIVIIIGSSAYSFYDYYYGNTYTLGGVGIGGGIALMFIGWLILILGAVASFFKIDSEIVSEEVKRQIQAFVSMPQATGSQPSAASAVGYSCPTCGGPLRFVPQYQKWYCDREGKYV